MQRHPFHVKQDTACHYMTCLVLFHVKQRRASPKVPGQNRRAGRASLRRVSRARAMLNGSRLQDDVLANGLYVGALDLLHGVRHFFGLGQHDLNLDD